MCSKAGLKEWDIETQSMKYKSDFNKHNQIAVHKQCVSHYHNSKKNVKTIIKVRRGHWNSGSKRPKEDW